MKRIALKKMSVGDDVIVWAEVIQQLMRQPIDPQRGASIEEMRKSIRVLDALENSNGVLELEDADWEHLKTKVTMMQWGVIDRRIVQFVDEVTSATEVPQ